MPGTAGRKAMQTAKEGSKENNEERFPVVSLRVNVSDYDASIRRIVSMTREGRGGYVCMSTVHMVMEGYDSPEFGEKVNGANLVLPDGMPLVWMQKLQGARNADRVRANELMIRLFRYSEKHGLRIGLYGGRSEVLEGMVKRAEKEFPDLEIVYAHSPPFRPLTPEEEAGIAAELAEKDPEILFVGLGCPKQESWMHARKESVRSVMIGVGASFDFFCGNISEAPMWMQKAGLEWLYRLSREPGRLWKRYLILNPRFVALAVRQLVAGDKVLRTSRGGKAARD